jgi:hypothetical protein
MDVETNDPLNISQGSNIDPNENLAIEGEEPLEEGEDFDDDDDDEEVYCLCKQPWGGKFMICCDTCDIWYHAECIGLKEEVAKTLKGYTCKFCRHELDDEVFEEKTPKSKPKPKLKPVPKPKATTVKATKQKAAPSMSNT